MAYYGALIRFFRKKYRNRFEIKKHFFPDIDEWRYKVKWQFPRSLMDYNFQPRIENKKIISEFILDSPKYIISEFSDSIEGYNTIFINDFKDFCNKRITNRSSLIGCLILLIRNSSFVIGGSLNSFMTKLSLLLKTPVISIGNKISVDSINLINPFDTPVISCRFIEEGIEIYENNF